MQDHRLDPSAAAPVSIEHLDLVTAELRRRIAGIGLAIAELREETGRLRASADERYHAVAVLDRPIGAPVVDAGADAAITSVLDGPSEPAPGPSGSVLVRDRRPTEPIAPWSAPTAPAPIGVEPIVIDAISPEVAPVAEVVVAPAPTPDAPSTWTPDSATQTAAPERTPEIAPVATATVAVDSGASVWGDESDDDAAAFDAFFSAEIEPEPSQRWLLSD